MRTSRYLLWFLLIAGMAWGQDRYQWRFIERPDVVREHIQGHPDLGDSLVCVNTSTGRLTELSRCSDLGPLINVQIPRPICDRRLEVMQKALDYIAKMAARNPHEEQDAGEFLERMGRLLAGSEGK